MRRLARKHDVIAITVDDPRESEFPDAGWIELEDAERGGTMLVNTSSPTIRLGLRVAAEEIRIKRTKVFETANVDHIPLRTDIPYAPILLSAFQRRAKRYKR